MAEQFQSKIMAEIRETLNPKKALEQYVPNMTRATDELGLTPLVSINGSILPEQSDLTKMMLKAVDNGTAIHCL